MNIFTFIFLFLLLNVQASSASIEIYSAGQRFGSIEDYQKINKGNPVESTQLPNSVPKTPVVEIDPDQQKMYKVSYNNAVHHMVVNFQQNWQNPKPKFILGQDELEYTLKQDIQDKQGAALLISDSKKLRILSYNPQQGLSLEGKSTK